MEKESATVKYPHLRKLDHSQCKPVICKECGKEFHSLTSHLRKHKMTSLEYRLKWDLTKEDIICSALREYRRKKAKEMVKEGKLAANQQQRADALKKYREKNQDMVKIFGKRASELGQDKRLAWWTEERRQRGATRMQGNDFWKKRTSH